MAQRDYAARSTKKKKSAGLGKSVLLTIACVVVLGFALGLYFLTTKAPEPQSKELTVEQAKPKSQLPSRPEESWSYIKELERRTVPTDNSQASLEKVAQLSEKQKEDLKRLEEAEKKAALERASKTENNAQDNIPVSEATSVAATATAPVATITDEAVLKAETEKKAAEQAKKEEESKKAELAKQQAAKETTKSDSAKASGGKFGLQCGAFNDRAKAEALQAKLAMTGLNARITESGKWNRVLVGPIGDRQAASAAQQQAGSVANCVIIGM